MLSRNKSRKATLNCGTIRPMATKKNLKTHKINSSIPSRSGKAASKASKSTAKSKTAKKKEKELKEREKLYELTLKVFQTVYEDYQAGKFHRIL